MTPWQERNAAELVREPLRVALIACARTKLEHAAPAKALYCSSLFQKAYAWSEAHCDERWIISAKHRLLSPETIVEPYEHTLRDMSKREIELWGFGIANALFRHYAGRRTEFVFLAGEAYREPIIEDLKRYNPLWTWSAPLAHKGIGEQMAALSPVTLEQLKLI